MFLPLPLAIWLSLVLAGLAVSDCGLSLLQACVSVLLGDQFSLGGIWVWRAVAQGQLQAQMETRRIPSQAAPQFLCSGGNGGWFLLGQILEQWWSHLCSQECQHSWETLLFPNRIWTRRAVALDLFQAQISILLLR